MKLTKSKLKQLIKEELKATLTELTEQPTDSPLLTIKKAYNALQDFVAHTPDNAKIPGKKFKAIMAVPLAQLRNGIAALEKSPPG